MEQGFPMAPATYHRTGSLCQVVQSFKHKVIHTLLPSEIV